MESIIKETLVSFKDFEKKIFVAVCELGQEITKRALEAWDDELAGTRDKVVYRDKGKRTTSIKTLYGTVSYRRRVYQTKQEDGKSRYVYLLDEWMGREPKGLFSANLVESIVHAATELSYRAAAEQVSRTCGQAGHQPWRGLELGAGSGEADLPRGRGNCPPDGSWADGRDENRANPV